MFACASGESVVMGRKWFLGGELVLSCKCIMMSKCIAMLVTVFSSRLFRYTVRDFVSELITT